MSSQMRETTRPQVCCVYMDVLEVPSGLVGTYRPNPACVSVKTLISSVGENPYFEGSAGVLFVVCVLLAIFCDWHTI